MYNLAMEGEPRLRSFQIDANIMILSATVSDMLEGLSEKAKFYGMEFPIGDSDPYKGDNSGNIEKLMPQVVKFLSHNFDSLSYDEKILVCIGWEGLWGQGKPPQKVTDFENDALDDYYQQRQVYSKHSDPGLETILMLKAIDTDVF